ncbi:hypothetical protein ACLE20_13445 [Rhizobium sp. YIM 134829]|uniref:hypothetical protein n=1 Tax=Rhizobium sp. YIM 134829 TaxID=3390453 RepID=UPI00397CFE71
MANPLYARLQATAERLIAKFGQSGTLTRSAKPDAVEGGEPVGTPYTVTLVPMTYEAREIDGTLIKVGDVKLYLSAVGLPIDPKPGDLVTANGKTFRIVNGDPNRYDGVTPVVHICQARTA